MEVAPTIPTVTSKDPAMRCGVKLDLLKPYNDSNK